MDFMNLNQAAHGDREFAARPDPARRHPQDRRRSRLRPRGRPPRRRLGPGRPRPRRAVDHEARPLRRQHAQRRRHRGRQGRGRAPLRRLGQHLGRQRPRRGGRRASRTTRSTPSSPSTPTSTTSQAELLPGGDRHDSLRYGARIEAGPAALPDRRRLHGVHHQLRGPRRAAPAARPGRAAADGRRLRLRRRGRLEDLGHAAHPQGGAPTALPGGTSFMEDYTYHLVPGEEKILGAHMLEVCPSIAGGQAARWRSTRSASAAARTPCAWSSTPRPGAGRRPRHGRPRRPVPLRRQRGRRSSRRTSRCRTCRSPAPCGGRSRTSARPRRPG